jgi:hypothetical protein
MSISTVRIEEFIEGQVSEMIHAKDFPMPSRKAKTEDKDTKDKRERLQRNYGDSFEMFVQGTIDREQLEAAKARLSEQLEKLGPKTKSAAAVEAENLELTSLISHWDQAGRPEKRMVIRHLIDRVVITEPNSERAKAKGGRFDYERADIQWAKYEDGVRQPLVKLRIMDKAAEARSRR